MDYTKEVLETTEKIKAIIMDTKPEFMWLQVQRVLEEFSALIECEAYSKGQDASYDAGVESGMEEGKRETIQKIKDFMDGL